LVIIMGKSFLIIPYHTHKASPAISINSITQEMLSAFFSLMIFINCGKSEIDVHIPAAIPTELS